MRADSSLRPLLLWRRPGAPCDRWLGARRLTVGWVVVAAVLGMSARLLAATQGHNYDIESYWIVANIVDEGGNVYAETHRYNYGPAWFLVLGLLKDIADQFPEPFVALRYLVPTFLSGVDLAIAAMLLRRFGALSAVLFLLHPVSILITGYHSQFDNLAIAVGLAAMLLLERDGRSDRAGGRAWIAGVAMLGLSLIVKHLLIVLPLWLAIRQRSPWRAAAVLLVPTALLAASFLPFVAQGGEGIVRNVIGYRSFDNAPFLNWAVPPIVARHLSATILVGLALLIAGWFFRRRRPSELLLVYSVTITVFAPAIANQYLAIPSAATAVFPNAGYLLYVVTTALYLVADASNLGIQWVAELLPGFLVRHEMGDLAYAYLVVLLAAGFAITAVELYRASKSHDGTGP